jgi:hypothetical protein
MNHRIWLSNGKYYDVSGNVTVTMVNQLVSVRTIGKFPKSIMVNKDHIVAIEEIHEFSGKDRDNLMTSAEWNEKVKQMDREKSKKKFKQEGIKNAR